VKRLNISPDEYDSLFRLVRSRLDMTLHRSLSKES